MSDAELQRAMEWKRHLIDFLIPRLVGEDADKEVALEMVFAAMHEAHCEGVNDSAFILHKLASHSQGDRKTILEVAERALANLVAMNRQGREYG